MTEDFGQPTWTVGWGSCRCEMPRKTVRKALADALEDLSSQDLDKFCRALVDRKEDPRVRRAEAQSRNFLDIADVLVTTFTEAKAIGVAADLLRQIDCQQDAESLRKYLTASRCLMQDVGTGKVQNTEPVKSASVQITLQLTIFVKFSPVD